MKHLLRPFVTRRQLLAIESLSRSFSLNGLACYFVGGYALDALRGKVTREHRDLDIVVLDGDIDGVLAILAKQGFAIHRKASFVWKATREPQTIDLFWWKRAGNGMIQHVGACGIGVRVPEAFWNSGRPVTLRGARFRIPSNDYLACMGPLTHEDSDVKFGNGLPTSAPLQCRVQTEQVDGAQAKMYEFTPRASNG